MGEFLKQNWFWILVPFVALGVVLLLAHFLGGGRGMAPMDYPLF